VVLLTLPYFQFNGKFAPKTQLTLMAPRAGLVMDSGSKVTYNGVVIGKVADVEEIDADGEPAPRSRWTSTRST
jgi:phospholipid/cholesterol/gamma-HCH transport system substrate-binding protein